MSEDTETLFELMLTADQFCSQVDSAVQDLAPTRETEELRLKIAQGRTFLREIRKLYDEERLTLDDATTRANFRQMIMTLMWIAFYGREVIEFRLFRKLVMVESTFAHLLSSR